MVMVRNPGGRGIGARSRIAGTSQLPSLLGMNALLYCWQFSENDIAALLFCGRVRKN